VHISNDASSTSYNKACALAENAVHLARSVSTFALSCQSHIIALAYASYHDTSLPGPCNYHCGYLRISTPTPHVKCSFGQKDRGLSDSTRRDINAVCLFWKAGDQHFASGLHPIGPERSRCISRRCIFASAEAGGVLTIQSRKTSHRCSHRLIDYGIGGTGGIARPSFLGAETLICCYRGGLWTE